MLEHLTPGARTPLCTKFTHCGIQESELYWLKTLLLMSAFPEAILMSRRGGSLGPKHVKINSDVSQLERVPEPGNHTDSHLRNPMNKHKYILKLFDRLSGASSVSCV